MTPADFKAAREACGLSLADWAYALGYRHAKREKARQQAFEMECGRKPISPRIAERARALLAANH